MLLLFLNELSLGTIPCRFEAADAAMSGLYATLRAIGDRRPQGFGLVPPVALQHVQIAPDQPYARWHAHTKLLDRDQLRFIKSAVARAPFGDFSRVPTGDASEYMHGERSAGGLGFAHALDGMAVSLRLDGRWDAHLVDLTRRALVEGADGQLNLLDEPVAARHASTPGNVRAHAAWLEESGMVQVHVGRDIWERRMELYPHLVFLPRVEADLIRLERYHVGPVKEQLLQLERAAGCWDPSVTPSPEWRSHVTPEGQRRKALCYFSDADGAKHLYDWHARFTPHAGRIHFRADTVACKVEIAYIGMKLDGNV